MSVKKGKVYLIGAGPGDWKLITVKGLEAIKKAGSLDTDKINAAFPTLDMPAMNAQVKFNKDHFSRQPMFLCQWFKVDKPEKWEMRIVLSQHDWIPVQSEPIFPLP